MRQKQIYIVGSVLAVSAFFVANVPLTASLWPISLLAILLFSAPVFLGSVQWFKWRTGLGLMAGLGIYALVFETLAVIHNVPYGSFNYYQLLGPKLFGITPLSVLVAWSPIVLGVIASLPLWRIRYRIFAGTLLMVAVDLVLDPAAVQLGFWSWDIPGIYYGVPVINFFGWVISSSIAVCAVLLLQQYTKRFNMPVVLHLNLLAIIFFWLLVNLFSGHWVPCLIGGVLIFILVKLRSSATLTT